MFNRLKYAREDSKELRSYINDIKTWKRASEALGAIAAAHRCRSDESLESSRVSRSGNVIDITGAFDPRVNDITAQGYLDKVRQQPVHVRISSPELEVTLSDLSETI